MRPAPREEVVVQIEQQNMDNMNEHPYEKPEPDVNDQKALDL
jgi:hypothetical protein